MVGTLGADKARSFGQEKVREKQQDAREDRPGLGWRARHREERIGGLDPERLAQVSRRGAAILLLLPFQVVDDEGHVSAEPVVEERRMQLGPVSFEFCVTALVGVSARTAFSKE